MNRIYCLLAILGITQLAGCAFGSRYTELSYPPEKQVEIAAPQNEASSHPSRSRYVVLEVTDDREDPSRVGNIRNTYGMKTASILTEDNIQAWVREAIVYELGRFGYQVLNGVDTPTDQSAEKLSASVQEVYCDIYMVYDGKVTLRAVLEGPNYDPIAAESSVKVNSGVSFTGSGSAAGESLAQALQSAVRSMLHDVGYLPWTTDPRHRLPARDL